MQLSIVYEDRWKMLDKSKLMDCSLFFLGYIAYVGYLCLEHTHTNPVLLMFSQLLIEVVTFNGNEQIRASVTGLNTIIARKAKNRWFLAIALINNPELRNARRQEKFTDRSAFTRLRNLAVEAFKWRLHTVTEVFKRYINLRAKSEGWHIA